jgi:hypothetical protein
MDVLPQSDFLEEIVPKPSKVSMRIFRKIRLGGDVSLRRLIEMEALPLPPDPGCTPLLPGADFADAFALTLTEAVTAPEAARRAFSGMPGWASRLLALRNAVVAPLGLRTKAQEGPHLGMFPIVSSAPERVVLGFDDWHLDFRIVMDVTPGEGLAGRAVLTTLVRRRHWFGRLYLAAVMPFHKRIVPAALARVAQG